MEIKDNTTVAYTSRIRRLKEYLVSSKAGMTIPVIFYAVLLFTPLLMTAMTFFKRAAWQISGYYLDGLIFVLIFSLGLAWLLSIIILIVERKFERGIKRIVAIPAILFIGWFIAVIPRLFLPSTISGWPLDSVYSPVTGKYYILAYGPGITDVTYVIFSTNRSLLNPIWRVEVPGNILDYSEDGSLVENPKIILSKDERLLVVERGGHLTDAVLVGSKQPLTQYVSWMDEDRERKWQKRTEVIRQLLDSHSGDETQSTIKLSKTEVKMRIDDWSKEIEPRLTQMLSNGNWQAICSIDEISEGEGGRYDVSFAVTCKKGDTLYDIRRQMSVIQDGGRLMVVNQDTGLSWSNSEEKILCEGVRTAMLEIAPSGTYLNCPRNR